MNLTTGLAINNANYKVLNFKGALTLKVSSGSLQNLWPSAAQVNN